MVHFILTFFTVLLVALSPAKAETVTFDETSTMDMDMPMLSSVHNDEDEISATHPVLNLTQDKSEMVRLDSDAASVIVGNPNHVSVLLDTPTTLVVVPRAAGASHFTVIGKDGEVIMQRHVVVGGGKEQYVRIRRSCGSNSRGCEATSVYFCPDMCHEVKENTQR